MSILLKALVSVPLASQTTTPSQSWRWPSPLEHSSFGMYQDYIAAQLPLYSAAQA